MFLQKVMLPWGTKACEQCLVAAWMVTRAWLASSCARASPSGDPYGLHDNPQSAVLTSSSYMTSIANAQSVVLGCLKPQINIYCLSKRVQHNKITKKFLFWQFLYLQENFLMFVICIQLDCFCSGNCLRDFRFSIQGINQHIKMKKFALKREDLSSYSTWEVFRTIQISHLESYTE